MAYVITDTCVQDSLARKSARPIVSVPKDEPGFEAATQIYVDPEGCID